MINTATNELDVNNENWKYALSTLDSTSQNQYTRTIERYNNFCTIEGFLKESTDSIEKFLIFCKTPEVKLASDAYAMNNILPKDKMAAKTLWSVLSHIKKYFIVCTRRKICEEDIRLNGLLQQWEKSEEVSQAKVSFF